MSIINQMLKDLDKRSKQPASSDILFSGLRTSISSDFNLDSKRYRFMVGIIIFIIATLVLTYKYSISHHRMLTSKTKAPVSTPLVSPMASPVQEKKLPPSSVSLSTLTGITLQTQQDMTYLRFLLNRNTIYKIQMDKLNHTLMIIFEQARAATDLPAIQYLQSAIKNIAITSTPDNHLQVRLTLQPTAEVQKINYDNTTIAAEPELEINFSMASAKTVLPAVENTTNSVKQPTTLLTPEQQYARALQFIQLNQYPSAQQSLIHLLQQFPEFSSARETLIQLFLAEGNKNKAMDMLNIGLAEQPDYPPFMMLKARILVEEGKVDNALHLLLNVTPPLTRYPDYYAFIAGLYQREGKFNLAVPLYEELLSLEPSNAIWWVGLGIALEGIGKENQAMEAYAHASESHGLTPELTLFLQNKLQG